MGICIFEFLKTGLGGSFYPPVSHPPFISVLLKCSGLHDSLWKEDNVSHEN